MSPRLPAALACGLALATVAAAGAAHASTVLLVRPPNSGGVTAEAMMRMHGELSSAGFDVSFATSVAGVDARASLEMLASAPGIDAVVAILGEAGPDAIEVWVADRMTGKSMVRRTPYQAGGERDAEVLAIRAIELLRASLLEVDIAGRSLVHPPPVAVAPRVGHDSGGAFRVGIEVGASALLSFDGLGPAVLPELRVDGVLAPWCVVQARLAGLGTRARVDTLEGSGHVAQQFGLAGLGLRGRLRGGVRPVLTLAAGVLRTSAEGRATWPYAVRSEARWSFLADAGLGMHLELAARYALAVEAHLQLAEPYPIVRVAGADAATVGRPTLLFTVAVVAWL